MRGSSRIGLHKLICRISLWRIHVQCSSPAGRCKRREPTSPDGVLSHMRGPSDPKDGGEGVILSLCGHDLRRGLALLHRLLLRGASGGRLENTAGGAGCFGWRWWWCSKGETTKLEHHHTILIGVTLQIPCIVIIIFLIKYKLKLNHT